MIQVNGSVFQNFLQQNLRNQGSQNFSLVQHGRNNPPGQKSSKLYQLILLPFAYSPLGGIKGGFAFCLPRRGGLDIPNLKEAGTLESDLENLPLDRLRLTERERQISPSSSNSSIICSPRGSPTLNKAAFASSLTPTSSSSTKASIRASMAVA